MTNQRYWIWLCAVFLAAGCQHTPAPVTASGTPESGTTSVSFSAADGLEVTADLYPGKGRTSPVVVLFHQSMSSRGEFLTTAPRLARLGYNALAVDLRWGGRRNGVVNRTAERNGTAAVVAAVEAGTDSPWATIDASYHDMVAAVGWLRDEWFEGPLYALGSSFSAMGVYRLGAEGLVDEVLAYSPGEYDDSRPGLVRGWASAFDGPVLAVAAPGEEEMVNTVHAATRGRGSKLFVAPAGRHGASILDADERNWQMLAAFLGHHLGGPPQRAQVRLPVPGGHLWLDRYEHTDRDAPTIVLLHQGGGSARGEYGFIVADLLDAGFHVLTPDLHGGGDRFGIPNRTLLQWPEPEGFSYCDALPQVEAVLGYARDWKPGSSLTGWGSSYSGALVLHAAARNPELMDRVAAFSPASGGPMTGCGADAELAVSLDLPLFLARPESEAAMPSVAQQVAAFRQAGHRFEVVPDAVHGSSMLNPMRVSDPQPLRQTVLEFLQAEAQ